MATFDEIDLRQRCRVTTNLEGDTFVGIKSEDGEISVCFPLGYKIPEDDKSLRTDVVRLIAILSRYAYNQDQRLPVSQMQRPETVDFPIQAYMSIISDYMQNDYFTENEVLYRTNHRGKINWAKTIKHQKPLPQGNSLVYLQYVVKDSISSDDSLISLIHEYCVFESFKKLGWLYTSTMPKEPRIQRFDKELFTIAVYDKLGQTFNDKHKDLFNNMLSMINYLGQKDVPQQFYFGTERFEYVWEKLIDFTFGVANKNKYFPKTKWVLRGSKGRDNAALEPDTIMICNNKIYVIDAKYYKYGVTGNPYHLPESTAINKQITYGEYIDTEPQFKNEFGQSLKVYNAFLMPFDHTDVKKFATLSNYRNIGEGISDWKKNNKEYERVQGVLVDVRALMYNVLKQNPSEIERLSAEIEKAFEDSLTDDESAEIISSTQIPQSPQNGSVMRVNI